MSMNAFKRISIALTAQINGLIDQIEDQEAVANAALADIRDSLMKTRFQVKRIQHEQKAFEARITQLRDEEAKWKDRALRTKDENHDRALECVRRLKKTREEIASTEQQLDAHQKLELQLGEDVAKIEARFEELKRKRSLLIARESRAEAMRKVSEVQNNENLGGIFDRWEQ